ncbi:MAG: hypothetical protein D6702_06825 [Planctomycetota bacterium]|nr:MAG: hypothetical protein D6702_06825 [Planctomycetota bacterium]
MWVRVLPALPFSPLRAPSSPAAAVPFPGIPDDVLAALEEPNPLDEGLLRAAVAELAEPADAPLRTILDHGRLILAGNRVANLCGARDWENLIGAHLLDAVRAAAFVPTDARLLADWGSGAGLPGLVWAALFPDKEVLLIERNGKKAAFLEEAALRLGLLQVAVLRGQGEETLAREGLRPDLIAARAVEPLPRLLGRLRRNRVRFGAVALLAGPGFEAEWERLAPELRRSWRLAARHPYELPGRGRRLVAVLKPA